MIELIKLLKEHLPDNGVISFSARSDDMVRVSVSAKSVGGRIHNVRKFVDLAFTSPNQILIRAAEAVLELKAKL